MCGVAMWRGGPRGLGCGQEIDDVLDGFVGAVVGEFEAAAWAMVGVRPVVKAVENNLHPAPMSGVPV